MFASSVLFDEKKRSSLKLLSASSVLFLVFVRLSTGFNIDANALDVFLNWNVKPRTVNPIS